jgi:type I restriction enzyme S subunit
MNHGLSEKTVNQIFSVFERFPEIEKAVLYGSRAKGNFKTGSDIDLTLYGEKLSSRLLGDIAEALDDLLLPYTIDLSIFDDLNHAKLREHIERVGVVFYEKKNQNMKAGWEIKNFENVLEIKNGRNQKAVQKENGQYPIYGSAGNVMGWTDDYICEAGTTIIGRKGTINNPIYTETKFWNVDTAFGLSPKEFLDSKFLHYFCISYDFSEHNRGTTIPSLVKTDLLQIKIPIPPIPEQKRLVTLLDEAFESIATAKANAEQNLKNARALFESHLNEVFTKRGEGWEEKTLGEVCQIKPPKSEARNKISANELVSFLPMENLGINKKFVEAIKEKPLSEVAGSYTYFANGDVLLAKITPCFENGKLGIAENLTNGIGFGSSEYVVFRPDNTVNKEWLYYYLSREIFRLEGAERMTGAVGHKRVTKEFIECAPIFILPMPQQNMIISKLDALSEETQRLEALYSRKIAALDELKKALLHRAFSGEL